MHPRNKAFHPEGSGHADSTFSTAAVTLKDLPTESKTSCNTLESLQAEYKRAERELRAIAKKVRAARGKRTKEHALLGELSDRAKAKSEAAHRSLRNHIIEYGAAEHLLLPGRVIVIARYAANSRARGEKTNELLS